MQILSDSDGRELLEFLTELGQGRLILPSPNQLEKILEVAFWASLEKEEGRPVEFTLLFSPESNEHTSQGFRFAQGIEFSIQKIVKLAPALLHDYRAIKLTTDASGHLWIEGVGSLPTQALTLKADQPGQLTLKIGDRVRALIRRGRVTYLTNDNTDNLLFLMGRVAEYPINPTARFVSLSQAFEMVLRAMIRQGHGGTILWLPNEEAWQDGVKSVNYLCDPPHSELSEAVSKLYETDIPLFRRGPDGFRNDPQRQELLLKLGSIQPIIDAVGQVTAVDGATVVSEDLKVLAFGVMLRAQSADGSTMVRVLESFGQVHPHSSALHLQDTNLSELGGARHRSAAEFCQSHQKCLAFVASQDGNLTVFGWQHQSQNLFAIRGAELLLL